MNLTLKRTPFSLPRQNSGDGSAEGERDESEDGVLMSRSRNLEMNPKSGRDRLELY